MPRNIDLKTDAANPLEDYDKALQQFASQTDATLSDAATLIDKMAARVSSAKKQMTDLAANIQKVEKQKAQAAPDSAEFEEAARELGKLKTEYAGLADEVEKANSTIDKIGKTFNQTASDLKSVSEALGGVSTKLKPEDWDRYGKAVGTSTVEFARMRGEFQKAQRTIEENTKELRKYQSQMAAGTKLTVDQQSEVARLTAENERMRDVIGVVESVVDSYENVVEEIEEVAAASTSLTDVMRDLGNVISPEQWDAAAAAAGKHSDKVREQAAKYETLTDQMREEARELADLELSIRLAGDESGEAAKKAQELRESLAGLADERAEIGSLAEAIVRFEDEVEEGEKSLNLFQKKMQEGVEEAKRFAGGLGGSATGALALGVALVYAAGKVKELSDRFVGMQKEFARYQIQTNIAARQLPVSDASIASLESLRRELRLTTSEAAEFQKVLVSGSVSGVASVEQLAGAARKLEAAFGEDPTKRLETYIDLLKEIPSLETDLRITASLDDQAEAWFALAQQGKVQQAIEIQMAGLLGADQEKAAIQGSEAQVETLHAINRTNQVMEDVQRAQLATLGGISTAAFATAGGLGILTKTAFTQTLLLRRINRKVGGTDLSRGILGRITDKIRERIGGRTTGVTGGIVRAGKTVAQQGLGGAVRTVGTKVLATSLGVAGAAAATFATVFAGTAVVLSKYGDEISDAAKESGRFLKETNFGKMLDVFLSPAGATIGAFTGSATKASDAIEWFGEKTKVAGEQWDTWFSGAKDWVSATSDFLFVSEKERKARQDAAREAEQRADLERSARQELERVQSSAKALQSSLGAIKAANDSQITALAKLRQEVSALELEQLANLGGSAAEFKRALSDGVAASTREFDRLGGSFAKIRRDILNNADMNATDRRNALTMLHKAEIEATQKFTQAILKSVGQYQGIPDVVKNTLESGIEKRLLDLELSIGTEVLGDPLKRLSRIITKQSESLAISTEQAIEDFRRLPEASKKLEDMMKRSGREVGTELEKLKGSVVDAQDVKLLERLEGTVEIDARGLHLKSGKIGEISDVTKEAAERISDLNKQYEIVSAVSMANLAELRVLDDSAKLTDEKFSAASESLFDANLSLGKVSKESSKHKALADEVKKYEDEYAKQAKESADIANKIAPLRARIVEAVERAMGEGVAEGKTTEELLRIAKGIVKDNIAEGVVLKNRLRTLETIETSSKKAIEIDKKRVDITRAHDKITQELVSQAEAYLSTLNSSLELLEKDPTVQRLQREAEIAQKRSELANLVGNSEEKFIESMEAQRKALNRQLEVVEETRANLEMISKGGTGLNAALEQATTSFDVVGENLKDVFGGDVGKILGSQSAKLQSAASGSVSAMRVAFGELTKAIKEGKPEGEIRALGEKFATARDRLDKALTKAQKLIGKDATIDVSGIVGPLDIVSSVVIATSGKLEVAFEEVAKKEADLLLQSAKLTDGYSEQLRAIDISYLQQATKAQKEYASTLFDAAAVSLNTGDAALAEAKAREATLKGQADALARIDALEKGALEDRETQLKAAKTEVGRAKIRAQFAKVLNEQQAARQKVELDAQTELAQASERRFEAERKIIDFERERLDIQRDLLEATGASIGMILDVQGKSLALAQREANIAKEAYENYMKNTPKEAQQAAHAERLKLNYAKAAAEVTKQAMGLQRDAYDKLLEKTFGAIRAQRGARRGLLSRAAVMGRGQAIGPGGLVVPEGAVTIAGMQARRLATAGRVPEGSKAAEMNLSAAKILQNAQQGFGGYVDQFGRIVGSLDATPMRHEADKAMGNLYSLAKGEGIRTTVAPTRGGDARAEAKAINRSAKANEQSASVSERVAEVVQRNEAALTVAPSGGAAPLTAAPGIGVGAGVIPPPEAISAGAGPTLAAAGGTATPETAGRAGGVAGGSISVEVTFGLDGDGNITPSVRRIVKNIMPEVVRSPEFLRSASAAGVPVRNMTT